MVRKISERQGKGFEVQWYDANGNAADVYQIDTIEELAQHLAGACWSSKQFVQNPTVWKNGSKWCFGDSSEEEPEEAPEEAIRPDVDVSIAVDCRFRTTIYGSAVDTNDVEEVLAAARAMFEDADIGELEYVSDKPVYIVNANTDEFIWETD